MIKQRFKKQFAKRVFTRFHMILILLGTILSGVIFSKILLAFGLDHIIARFITVLVFAYVIFFILMQFTPKKLSLLVFFCLLTGCSSVQHGDGGDWVGFTESGKASYYANKHQNRRTASGEIYQHDLKTAAHKKIPFGSIVKVTNVKNGKSVIVKINDRGPFVKGRIIDLSKSAFKTIGSISSGLINVKIMVVR